MQLEETSRDLRQYIEGFERDPQALEQIETRLSLIRTLKRKYGENEQAILDYGEEIRQELETLLSSEITIEKLKQEEDELYSTLTDLARQLPRRDASALRKWRNRSKRI